jgi:hypothetical protein
MLANAPNWGHAIERKILHFKSQRLCNFDYETGYGTEKMAEMA